MAESSRRATSGRIRSVLPRIGGLCALALVAFSTLGPTCGPAPAPAAAPVEPDDVRTIEDFVSCLNGKLAGNPDVDISDTVQCLPPKCSITLTMSNTSAQPACFSLGGCQMPRILLDCPGPPRFMPSYSLCYSDAGSERVEMGQAVDEPGNMQMGDLHIDPGAFEEIDPADVLSEADSKGCNSNGATCHDSVGDEEYSSRIDPWDTNTFGNPDCIIDTDNCDPDKQAITEPSACFEEDGAPRIATPESLEEVCQCIRDAADPGTPGYDPEDPIANEAYDYLRDLCDALELYQTTRGACTMAGCPAATGPPCDEPEASCDPSDGSITGVMAGYHCKAVEGDGYQCIADCPCHEYDLLGGGKFLINGAVSMVRVELDGLVATADPGEFSDDDAITGTLSAFNYLTHTLIDSVSLSSLEATQTGADFSVTGAGTALVNGVTTNVEFDASQTGSAADFELRNADTSAVLAGGVGEDDRSAFQLTVGP